MSGHHIESTSEANEHARVIDLWWREHRSATPDLFLDELTRALALLSTLPMLGIPYENTAVPEGTRRLLMRRVKCHLYYTVDAATRSIFVRAIWHSSRGSNPF